MDIRPMTGCSFSLCLCGALSAEAHPQSRTGFHRSRSGEGGFIPDFWTMARRECNKYGADGHSAQKVKCSIPGERAGGSDGRNDRRSRQVVRGGQVKLRHRNMQMVGLVGMAVRR